MNTIKVLPHYVTIPFVVVSYKASASVAVTTPTVYTASLAVAREMETARAHVLFCVKFCERCLYGYRISIDFVAWPLQNRGTFGLICKPETKGFCP